MCKKIEKILYFDLVSSDITITYCTMIIIMYDDKKLSCNFKKDCNHIELNVY